MAFRTIGWILVLSSLARGQQTTTGPVPPPGVDRGIRYHKGGAASLAIIPGVPAYTWRHGCAPTAVGMVIGYWDGHGCPDLVDGDAGQQSNADPMIAEDGGDPRCAATRSDHYRDYACPIDDDRETYPDPLPDRSETGGAHEDNCLADFMGTSRSAKGLRYGASRYWDIPGAFVEYVNLVASAYRPRARNVRFSETAWDAYTAEIDAGRPVVLVVDIDGDGDTDHAVTGVGYDDVAMEYAVHDTWDTGVHWYAWREVASGDPWGVFGLTLFEVSPQSEGLNLYADPPAITLGRNESSNVAAVLLDAELNPIPGAGLHFAITRLDGLLSPSCGGHANDEGCATTDAKGRAIVNFWPTVDHGGTARIEVSAPGWPPAEIDIPIVDPKVEIRLTPNLVERGVDFARYDIEVQVRDAQTGEGVSGIPVRIRAAKDGANAGTFAEGATNRGNPITCQTDKYGEVEPEFHVTERGLYQLFVEASGSSVVIPVRVWPVDPPDREPAHRLPLSQEARVRWNPVRRDRIAVATQDGRLHTYDPLAGTKVCLFSEPDDSNDLCYDPTGNFVAVRDDHRIKIFGADDCGDGGRPFPLNDLEQGESMDWSKNGRWIATGTAADSGSYVHVYDAESGQLVFIDGSFTGGLVVRFSPDNRYLAVAQENGDVGIQIYATATWSTRFRHRGPRNVDFHGVAWSPGSDRCVFGDDDGNLHVLDVSRWDFEAIVSVAVRFGSVPLNDLSWSPDGLLVAAACPEQDGAVLIQAAGWELVHDLPHPGVESVAWSPDGRFVVTGGPGGDVGIWAIDMEPPRIDVTSPENGATVSASPATIVGRITEETYLRSATIRVNGGDSRPLSLDPRGFFAEMVDLEAGTNEVAIEATDLGPNVSRRILAITYAAGATLSIASEGCCGCTVDVDGVVHLLPYQKVHAAGSSVTLRVLDGAECEAASISGPADWSRGEAVALSLGQDVSLQIIGYPRPALTVPAHDDDGTYEVSWTGGAPGGPFELEEAQDPGMTVGLRSVYEGTGSRVLLTGRSDGSYYYRIRAKYDAGPGNWAMGSNPCRVCCWVHFVRGDVNATGRVDISDAVFALNYLFADGPEPTCLKTVDTDDDGAMTLSDPISILMYLFADGKAPAAPFDACGTDPSADAISCASFAPCP
ncbi:MAG: hypothetical protein JXP34_26410 [Planctomycetes bacterium]|nr:hypothetical protein [Planctomycetota bacterium]